MAKLQHIDTAIPGHEKSIAYISTAAPQDVERAVIFVHGFGGDAKTTWTNFVALTSDPSIAGSFAPSLRMPAEENRGRSRSQPSVTSQHESLSGCFMKN
jgi:hypothetical protein